MKNRYSIYISNNVMKCFDEYCKQEGYKKSTLIEKLIKDFLKKKNVKCLTEKK